MTSPLFSDGELSASSGSYNIPKPEYRDELPDRGDRPYPASPSVSPLAIASIICGVSKPPRDENFGNRHGRAAEFGIADVNCNGVQRGRRSLSADSSGNRQNPNTNYITRRKSHCPPRFRFLVHRAPFFPHEPIFEFRIKMGVVDPMGDLGSSHIPPPL